YDPVGRITGFNAAGSQTGFSYDPNGNRTASTKTIGGQTTSRSYTVGSGSNRPQGFSQTTGGTTTNVSYGYNANWDMISDGLRADADCGGDQRQHLCRPQRSPQHAAKNHRQPRSGGVAVGLLRLRRREAHYGP